jgi:hypothetical protein
LRIVEEDKKMNKATKLFLVIVMLVGLSSFASATPLMPSDLIGFGLNGGHISYSHGVLTGSGVTIITPGFGLQADMPFESQVLINGQVPQTFDESVTPAGAGQLQFRGSATWTDPSNSANVVTVSWSGSTSSDPFINWGNTATTLGVSAAVSQTFNSLVNPTLYNGAAAAFSGSIGYVAGHTVTASNLITHNFLDGALVIDNPLAATSCTHTDGAPPSNGPCPAIGGQYGPLVAAFAPKVVNKMSTSIEYDLSKNAGASMQGQFTLFASVPEPASIAFVGAGLIGLAALGRRRFAR